MSIYHFRLLDRPLTTLYSRRLGSRPYKYIYVCNSTWWLRNVKVPIRPTDYGFRPINQFIADEMYIFEDNKKPRV